jgi:glucose/mannose transport system permease protein
VDRAAVVFEFEDAAVFDFVGLQQYQRLFATERFILSTWHIAQFGVLFIAGCLVLGLLLAPIKEK